jgi:hypothetical protein
MGLIAQSDAQRIEAVDERVALCMQRLLKAALALDRVLVARRSVMTARS